MARDISRPSLTAVTLQALLRRYFAIKVRVLRASSTTRMLGLGMAMRFVCPRFGPNGDYFCFVLFLKPVPQYRDTPRQRNGKVSLSRLTIAWRGHTRNTAKSTEPS